MSCVTKSWGFLLVCACKIGLSNFPIYCSNISSAFGSETPGLKALTGLSPLSV